MPIVPQYQSQVVPTSEAPSAIAPPKIGSAPWQAVEQAGSVVSEIGSAWNKKITEAKQGAEYGSAVAQMHVGLSDMYGKVTNNPAYKLDPDAGKTAWEEQSQKYIADSLANIKDPHVKQMVQNHSNEIWASHTISMNDWNRKQNVQNVGGTYLQNIKTFEDVAVNSESDDLFNKAHAGILQNIKGWEQAGGLTPQQSIEMMEKEPKKLLHRRAEAEIARSPSGFLERLSDPKGIYSGGPNGTLPKLDADEVGRLRHTAEGKSRTEQHQAEADKLKLLKQDKEHVESGAYERLRNLYNISDPNKNHISDADGYLNDPKNWESLGFKDDEAGTASKKVEAVKDRLHKEHERVRQMQSEAVTKTNSEFAQAIAQREASGKPMSATELAQWKAQDGTQPGGGVVETAVHRVSGKRDSETYQKFDKGLEDHPFQMKDTKELDDAFLSSKINRADYDRLLKKRKLWQDPLKSPALQDAKEAFWLKYGDGKIVSGPKLNDQLRMNDTYKKYIDQFEHLVDRQDLSPSQYKQQADLMLKDVDKAVIAGWFKWKTGTAKEYFDDWGAFPEEMVTKQSGLTAAPTVPSASAPSPASPEAQPAEQGNINYNTLPWVENPGGGHSSVVSMSFEDKGKEVLIPTISADGSKMTEKQAIARYRATGLHLGKFNTPDEANAYAKKHHAEMAPDSRISHIPVAARTRYIDILKKTGHPPTPANISHLYDQDKARGD